MSFVVVVVVFPLLLAVLSLGAGLFVESVVRVRLPAPLVPAIGFGALIVVSQMTVLSGTIAPATPWILAAIAIGGVVLSRGTLRERWASRGATWWMPAAAAAAAYLTVAAPLIATGHLTWPGYLLDTTAGFHLAAGEYMLHHGA